MDQAVINSVQMLSETMASHKHGNLLRQGPCHHAACAGYNEAACDTVPSCLTLHIGTHIYSPYAISCHTPIVLLQSHVSSAACASHPQRPLYITGSSSGHIYIWQYGEEHSKAAYIPVTSQVGSTMTG